MPQSRARMRPVVWSIEAQRNNLEILRYIAEDDRFTTERVVGAIEDPWIIAY